MPSTDKWAPSTSGVRDPRDPKKKNGIFWNWPRYLFFGGAAQGIGVKQAGDKVPTIKATDNAAGPISDRGRGRR